MLLSIHHPDLLSIIHDILSKHGVIAFPTDTVYGIGCLARDTEAIDCIYQIKGREQSKAIPVLIGNLQQLSMVVTEWPQTAQRLIEQFWPGALTLILQRQPTLPANLSPSPTIGVRLPDHPWLRDLIQHTGPLAVTSANLSGYPEARTVEEVSRQLKNTIDLIVDGGECAGGIPSTVVDCTRDPIQILREGAIPVDEIWRKINREL